MRTYVLKTINDSEPIVAMVCENVEVAKRFIKHKYKEHTAKIGKVNKKINKEEGISNDGKKLVIGRYVYEAKGRAV